LAPLTNPGKIFGSGVNYRSHGDEEPGFVFPDEVVWDFIKASSAIIGPGAPIVIPPADDVIVRRAGSPAPFHNGQRDLGKNFDTFCPMGPCLVTKDELPDWGSVRIQSRVNGELRQDA